MPTRQPYQRREGCDPSSHSHPYPSKPSTKHPGNFAESTLSLPPHIEFSRSRPSRRSLTALSAKLQGLSFTRLLPPNPFRTEKLQEKPQGSFNIIYKQQPAKLRRPNSTGELYRYQAPLKVINGSDPQSSQESLSNNEKEATFLQMGSVTFEDVVLPPSPTSAHPSASHDPPRKSPLTTKPIVNTAHKTESTSSPNPSGGKPAAPQAHTAGLNTPLPSGGHGHSIPDGVEADSRPGRRSSIAAFSPYDPHTQPAGSDGFRALLAEIAALKKENKSLRSELEGKTVTSRQLKGIADHDTRIVLYLQNKIGKLEKDNKRLNCELTDLTAALEESYGSRQASSTKAFVESNYESEEE